MNQKGINVIGFFDESFGLCESARTIINALKKSNIPHTLYPYHSISPKIYEKFDYSINLFCTGHFEIAHFIEAHNWENLRNHYNIALWFWETNIIPRNRKDFWKYMDEMWVTTRYVQEHLSIASQLSIFKIPQPIQNIPFSNAKKAGFGLSDKFTFLFCFDFASTIQRKNPVAIVHAFQKAFPSDQTVQLVIKSQHGHLYSADLEILKTFAKSDDRIILIDKKMDSAERFALMETCDCYISLHRSEGFGLTMAEAMMLEKPVIATGYSGNLDFMNEENSFLCNYNLIPIENNYIYPTNGIWADPHLDDAVLWMKQIVKDPKEARKKTKLGKEFLLSNHSLDAVGKQIQERIDHIQIPLFPKRRPLSHVKSNIIYFIRKEVIPKAQNLIKRIGKKLVVN